MKKTNKRGQFITFEGCDGVGKTTAVDITEEYLKLRGVKYLRTAEPSGTELGKIARGLIVDMKVTPKAGLILLAAARQQHIDQVIEPALAEGVTVICDRFVDSTFAYQVCGFNCDSEDCDALQQLVIGDLVPDLSILVSAPVDVALGRLADRKHVEPIEKLNAEFHHRVKEGFRQRRINNPWTTIEISSHYGFGMCEQESLLHFKQHVIQELYKNNIE